MQALKSKIKTVVSRINYTAIRNHGGPHISKDAPTIQITFINPNPSQAKKGQEDEKLTVDARIGETVLQTARRNHVDLEGACEGVCACSTCHIVLDNQLFDNLEEASEDEEDMLDMAFALTATSRLGCQVFVTDEMAGMEFRVPVATRNFYVDGHVPSPH
eukprot:scaffold433_cov260-Chaetoceros_neogracile.AAC.23